MQVYLITDKKLRVHQFIYPDRVWERTENGWASRELQKRDHTDRLEVCRGLVKNSISGKRLVPDAVTHKFVEKESEDEAPVSRVH